MSSADEIIRRFGLEPIPKEGGFFRRTYSSDILASKTPASDTQRLAGTAIYFLLTPTSFSALHKLRFDEVYHFYSGDPVDLVLLGEDGSLNTITLGSDFMSGQSPQAVAPNGVWQASRLIEGGKWALMGATMAPGFHDDDFELAEAETLIERFPQHSALIRNFTRNLNP